MKAQDILEIIWNNRRYEPKSELEAMSHLNEEVAKSLKALMRADKAQAQKELEDAFSCMMIVMKMMKMNADDVINRQVEQMQTDISKTMHIYSDRVEIRVENEVKGGWAIYSQEDMQDAQKMAQEFKCKVVWENANQLSLEDMLDEKE